MSFNKHCYTINQREAAAALMSAPRRDKHQLGLGFFNSILAGIFLSKGRKQQNQKHLIFQWGFSPSVYLAASRNLSLPNFCSSVAVWFGGVLEGTDFPRETHPFSTQVLLFLFPLGLYISVIFLEQRDGLSTWPLYQPAGSLLSHVNSSLSPELSSLHSTTVLR